MTIAYRYRPENNPSGAHLSGVPLRDLSLSEVLELPDHKQRTIQACPYYEATSEGVLLEDVSEEGQEVDSLALSEALIITGEESLQEEE